MVKRNGVAGVGLIAFATFALTLGRFPMLFVFALFVGGLWFVVKALDAYARAHGELRLIRVSIWGLVALVAASICFVTHLATGSAGSLNAAYAAFYLCGFFFCVVGFILSRISGFWGFLVGAVALCVAGGSMSGVFWLQVALFAVGFGLHLWGWARAVVEPSGGASSGGGGGAGGGSGWNSGTGSNSVKKAQK